MNYFAHGRRFTHDPYFLAGTAVPDWLNVVDRRMKVRSVAAEPFTRHDDPRVASLAAGVIQHHADDRWFHQTRAFAELNLQFTLQIRDVLADDGGFRPSFLGHILVELLLDATLFAESIAELDAYYAAFDRLDVEFAAAAIGGMATRQSPLLAEFIRRFCGERFLYDYLDDAKLLRRLNLVMRRVNLPSLPDDFAAVFAAFRQQVADRRDELLGGERMAETAAEPTQDTLTGDAS